MKNITSVAALSASLLLSCTTQEPMEQVIERGLERAAAQAQVMIQNMESQPANALPRTYERDTLRTIDYEGWVSGFFPGTLWQIYEATGKEQWRTEAERFTARVEPAKTMRNTHDLGFMIYCSFGQGYRLTHNPHYLEVIKEGTENLLTRFNPTVECILSWDPHNGWQYPVIIDNMMNLEMISFASKQPGQRQLIDFAHKHAKKTIREHYRPDMSCYHVVSYDTITGAPHIKQTHQGYADNSAWARGQAWGLYGYTMMYRETGDKSYLEQARKIAHFLKDHPRLPADKIPYWDFDAPDIPDAYRDASAGAIMASALIELSQLDRSADSAGWLELAEQQVRSLTSPAYLAEVGELGGFILKHGVGHKPNNSEVDVPLSYGDYYYVEALMRLKKLYAQRKEQVDVHNMHPLQQIADVKKQIADKKEPIYTAYEQLISWADSIQQVPEHSLVDFAVPGYYDEPEVHVNNSLALQHDAFGAYCSALAYRLTGEEKYGQKACYFLNAWADKNNRFSEHDGRLVMAYSGSGFLMAAELMEGSPLWSEQEVVAFKLWVANVYQVATNEIRVHKNNWADWGRFGALLAASFLNDKQDAADVVDLIKSDLFIKIMEDGHMPEEVRRGGNGLWYTYFSLAPMTAACWVAYNMLGENLFTLEQNGASIKKALDYLVYYTEHPDEWTWFEGVNAGSKSSTPGNLIEAMNGIYHDPAFEAFAGDTRPHIITGHHYAWCFPTLMPVSLK